MSYDAQEISVQSGAPIELYAFTYGTTTLRYTSSEADYIDTVPVVDETYTTASIERPEIESTPESARNTIKLTVPRTLAIAELYRVSPPSDVVSLTIKRVHRGDTASVSVIWIGRVIACTFNGPSADLQCEPITIALKRNGLRRLYGKSCPYVLYGTGCGVDKTAFDTATTVAAVDGLVLTVAAIGAYNYAGGFVEWVDGGVTERRFIESHDTTALTLMQAFAGIAVSDSVTIYPGCDRTLATCNTTFSNAANYGGWPFFPAKNPFNGQPVI